MRIMTKRQQRTAHNLFILAGRDPFLVERAYKAVSSKGGDLGDVIKFIREEVKKCKASESKSG